MGIWKYANCKNTTHAWGECDLMWRWNRRTQNSSYCMATELTDFLSESEKSSEKYTEVATLVQSQINCQIKIGTQAIFLQISDQTICKKTHLCLWYFSCFGKNTSDIEWVPLWVTKNISFHNTICIWIWSVCHILHIIRLDRLSEKKSGQFSVVRALGWRAHLVSVFTQPSCGQTLWITEWLLPWLCI